MKERRYLVMSRMLKAKRLSKVLFKNFAIGVIGACCSLVLFGGSCKGKKSTKLQAFLKQVAIRQCTDLLTDSNLPGSGLATTELILDNWKNDRLDPEPHIVLAVLTWWHPGDTRPRLMVHVSDEDSDILGIGITELHKLADNTTFRLEERYPVYHHKSPLGMMLLSFEVAVRENAERKNEEQWDRYMGLQRATIESIPPIYLSVPDKDNVAVSVWVYDRKGNVSNTVELECISKTDDASK